MSKHLEGPYDLTDLRSAACECAQVDHNCRGSKCAVCGFSTAELFSKWLYGMVACVTTPPGRAVETPKYIEASLGGRKHPRTGTPVRRGRRARRTRR